MPPKGRREYDPATKAACIAALLAGQRVDAVAAQYSIPEGTVKSWRAREASGATRDATVAPEKREQVGDLLIAYLHENLRTLREQQVVFRDPVWLRKQNAADVAVLHGVLTDKAVRLLEALGANGNAGA